MNTTGFYRTITVDGCGPRNLGATKSMGIGAVLLDGDRQPIEVREERHISPYATSNMSEFLAMELGLKVALAHDDGLTHWRILTDSKYSKECWYEPQWVKKPHLIPIALRWRELAAKLGWRVSVHWIDSDDNKLADAASRRAILNENFFGDMAQ